MTHRPLVSIVIDNYNYGHFVAAAIESALRQTYQSREVIVIDDGSTDNSREIIEAFGNDVQAIFKANGGQGSAFNAGFAASKGEIIVFLDSDDLLLPTAVERAVCLFSDPETSVVHWPLELVDSSCQPLGHQFPAGDLCEGDLRQFVYRHGPTHLLGAPGGGRAWARWFLAEVFPLPERLYLNGGDTFLLEAAPFFGKVGLIRDAQTLYRQHASNDHTSMSAEDKVCREMRFYDHYSQFLAAYCARKGVHVDIDAWRANSWWHLHLLLLQDIATLPHADGSLILIDDGTLERGRVAGRERHYFLSSDGQFSGAPADDTQAIQALEDLRSKGAAYVVLAWPSFWWRDHYSAFFSYLNAHFAKVIDNERCIVFFVGA